MKNKIEKGTEVYWMSVCTNYLTETIPINTVPSVRVHKGNVVSDDGRVLKVRAFINKDFVDNFDGVITGLEMVKVKKGEMPAAIFGILKSKAFTSMNDVKLSIIDFVLSNFDVEKL